jgi:hypothetical protein
VRSVYAADGIDVYQDVLDPAEFAGLRSWAEHVTYTGVHHDRWRPVWRLGEGEPLRGPTWSTSVAGAAAGDPPGYPPALAPLAAVLRRLLLRGPQQAARISLTPWIYPQGTALGLHRDDGQFAGSYIFYCVPEWDVHWGGLLNCVADTPEDGATPRAVLDPTAERASVAAAGRGTWISPVPNRLVTLAAHVRHFISRVDPNAGDRPRTSIAGFVHRAPDGPPDLPVGRGDQV